MLDRGMDRRLFLALAGATLAARPSGAAPLPYTLDAAQSTVAFTYTMNGAPQTGRMPILSADIVLDVDRPANSRVAADIDASRADAGPFYATEAMKSPGVLDVGRHPVIRFRSTRVRDTRGGATITGPLTVRGVTREIALEAKLFRPAGTKAGDRSRLSILMTGSLDRREFGAGGYPNIVGPTIRLQILAGIVRT